MKAAANRDAALNQFTNKSLQQPSRRAGENAHNAALGIQVLFSALEVSGDHPAVREVSRFHTLRGERPQCYRPILLTT